MALGNDGVGRGRQAQKVSAGQLLCGATPQMIGCAARSITRTRLPHGDACQLISGNIFSQKSYLIAPCRCSGFLRIACSIYCSSSAPPNHGRHPVRFTQTIHFQTAFKRHSFTNDFSCSAEGYTRVRRISRAGRCFPNDYILGRCPV